MHGVTKQVSGWGGSLQYRLGILVILWKSLVDVAFVSNKTVIISW